MQDEKNRKLVRITLTGLGGLAAALLLLWSAYRVWERPPAVATPTPEVSTAPSARPSAAPSPTMEPLPEGLAFDTPRQDGVYTFLLVGGDQVSYNTDTMLVGRIDTKKHEMNFVSLPRDTIINVDWEIRKLNAVYQGSRNNDGNGIDALRMHVRRLTGFDVDCYALIDINSFVDLIDGLGGVDFYVPFDMDYEDDDQGLYIHLKEGQQHLNGYQAMGLCRFRSAYVTGDLGRIEMQQSFLRAAADQFIRLGNIPNASIVMNLLSHGLDTNMSSANMAWFIRQALQCKSEDVHFFTMPCDQNLLQGYSYAVPRLGQWLDMINQRLNPYAYPVTVENVDIVYRVEGGYRGTGGLQGDWYYAEPGPEPLVTPEPTPPPKGPNIIPVTPKPPETWPPGYQPPSLGGEQGLDAAPMPTLAPIPAPTPPPLPAQPEAPPEEPVDETPDFVQRMLG